MIKIICWVNQFLLPSVLSVNFWGPYTGASLHSVQDTTTQGLLGSLQHIHVYLHFFSSQPCFRLPDDVVSNRSHLVLGLRVHEYNNGLSVIQSMQPHTSVQNNTEVNSIILLWQHSSQDHHWITLTSLLSVMSTTLRERERERERDREREREIER